MPLAFWVHDIDPFLVRFGENLGIRYYGVAYLLGFAAAAGLLILYHRRGRSPINLNGVTDLITAIVFGVLLGGRIGYFLLYQPATLLARGWNEESLERLWGLNTLRLMRAVEAAAR